MMCSKMRDWPKKMTSTAVEYEQVERDEENQVSVASSEPKHDASLDVDSSAVDLDYLAAVYPSHTRLFLAYIVEAFGRIGCDLATMAAGEAMPEMQNILPRHKRLLHRFFLALVEARILIETPEGTFVRTEQHVDKARAADLHSAAMRHWPEHGSLHQLMHAVGSRTAGCLTGVFDGLQILFGDQANETALREFYQHWPLFQMATKSLAKIVLRVAGHLGRTGKIQILEVGAGTGGTTRPLLAALQAAEMPFDYHFTDVSPHLVNAARQSLDGIAGLTFGVLDVEEQPPKDLEGAYDVVLASNCIHATRDLEQSLGHLRCLLREDGIFAMVEITRRLNIFDLVFGLLDGWWRFNDNRTHCLADEHHWSSKLMAAEFQDVMWTDVGNPEAQVVRVATASPRTTLRREASKRVEKTRVCEVVYKTSGELDILADVYCPVRADPAVTLPIGENKH